MLFFISTNQLAGYLPLLILNLTTYLSAGLENVIDQFTGQDSKTLAMGNAALNLDLRLLALAEDCPLKN